MFRRIAGSISQIFRTRAQNSINQSSALDNHQTIQSIRRTGQNSSEMESKTKARKALQEAVKELSKTDPKISQEGIQKLKDQPISALSTEEMEILATAFYGDEQDYRKAVEIWSIAAKKGSVASKFFLAQCILEGKGIERNDAEGYRLMLELSKEQNYNYAHYTLAKLCEMGQGVTQDYAAALDLYKKAALGGIAPSLHNIANAYAEGKGVQQSFETAKVYYEAAVAVDDPFASFTLGQWYTHGKGGLAIDKAKGFELQLKAAEKGHPYASFNVGTAYLIGDGVQQNSQQAIHWLTKAHEAGIEYATLNLAKMYLDGNGVPKDHEKAKLICQTIIDKNPVAKELFDSINSNNPSK